MKITIEAETDEELKATPEPIVFERLHAHVVVGHGVKEGLMPFNAISMNGFLYSPPSLCHALLNVHAQ